MDAEQIKQLATEIAGDDWETVDSDQQAKLIAEVADALQRNIPATEFAERALKLHRQKQVDAARDAIARAAPHSLSEIAFAITDTPVEPKEIITVPVKKSGKSIFKSK